MLFGAIPLYKPPWCCQIPIHLILSSDLNIKLEADNKIVIDAKAMYKLATPGTAEIVANSAMTIYSAVIRGVSDGVANRDSKVGGQDFQRKNNQ